MKFITSFLLIGLILSGCASKPPQQQENICQIFKDKSSWYRLVNRSEEQWGAPIHVQMSILRQESSFQNRVKPERTKLLGLIPWKRKSSAFGYSQAIDSTWNWYKKEENRPLASRVNFADAVDFTGWYINKTYKINGIKKNDAYNQYLAYHEGHGGYKNKTYKNQQWLINTAKIVDKRSKKYKQQLDKCKNQFKKKIFGIF
ncbi:MAG: transglycosylase SLT domain-containing protein [Candidatus Pelagibacterales bacterium]|jgi:hypothetical protein|tara:strand:- start:302 stop:904 length:603 start_codon:yes stop_codon:yes gene_type:complete